MLSIPRIYVFYNQIETCAMKIHKCYQLTMSRSFLGRNSYIIVTRKMLYIIESRYVRTICFRDIQIPYGSQLNSSWNRGALCYGYRPAVLVIESGAKYFKKTSLAKFWENWYYFYLPSRPGVGTFHRITSYACNTNSRTKF